jgi:4,5-dihydroxyphthalate decarboxylase
VPESTRETNPATQSGRPVINVRGPGSSRLLITFAISDYDHTRDFTSGDVMADGIEIVHHKLAVEEIFFRMLKDREFDVSELSFAKYTSMISQGDDSLVGIPVFPSRVFRHSSIYVKRGGPIKTAADLKGRKVGLPEWAQTASVYSRGFLVHQFGLKLQDIEWYQAGVNNPGRVEKVALKLPEGVRYKPMPEHSLEEMLLNGMIDAMASAHPPDGFEHGNPDIVRLFPDYQPMEEEYYKKTGVFPIMHVVAMRRDLYDRAPWLAISLFKGLDEAKRRSIARAHEMTASRFPIPWNFHHADQYEKMFGGDPFPYGIEPNRKTLEAFLSYGHEQGVFHRLMKPEELFPPQFGHAFKI